MRTIDPVIRALCAVALACLAAACRSGDPESADGPPAARSPDPASAAPALRTSADRYTLRRTPTGYEASIPFTYTNPTDAAVYVPSCRGAHPPSLEKRVDDGWELAWSPVVLLCLGPPVVIQAGESHADTLRLTAGYPGSDQASQFTVEDPEGEYRMVWTVYESYDPDSGRGEPLPLRHRISNTFVLEVEGP